MKVAVILSLVAAASAGVLHAPAPIVAGPARLIEQGSSQVSRQEDNLGNFAFGYDEAHTSGASFRRERGNANGDVIGSYGLRDADGRQRTVNYIADAGGFRVSITSNEPGVEPKDPAAILINKGDAPPPPVIEDIVAAGPVPVGPAVVAGPAPGRLIAAPAPLVQAPAPLVGPVPVAGPAFPASPIFGRFSAPAPVAVATHGHIAQAPLHQVATHGHLAAAPIHGPVPFQGPVHGPVPVATHGHLAAPGWGPGPVAVAAPAPIVHGPAPVVHAAPVAVAGPAVLSGISYSTSINHVAPAPLVAAPVLAAPVLHAPAPVVHAAPAYGPPPPARIVAAAPAWGPAPIPAAPIVAAPPPQYGQVRL